MLEIDATKAGNFSNKGPPAHAAARAARGQQHMLPAARAAASSHAASSVHCNAASSDTINAGEDLWRAFTGCWQRASFWCVSGVMAAAKSSSEMCEQSLPFVLVAAGKNKKEIEKYGFKVTWFLS